MAGVRYAFSGEEQGVSFQTPASELYKLDTSLESERLLGPEPPAGSTQVVALYYDAQDKPLGVGVDTLAWQGQSVEIKAPTLKSVEGAYLDLEVQEAVLAPGEETTYRLNLALADGSWVEGVTPFVEGLQMAPDPALELIAGQPGLLRGAQLGQVDSFTASLVTSFGTLEAQSEAAVYVTKQQVEGIQLVRLPIEGQEVTTYPVSKFEGQLASTILAFAPQNHLYHQVYADKKGVAMQDDMGGDYYAALVQQPLQVLATYGSQPDLGPTPPPYPLQAKDSNLDIEVQSLEGEAAYKISYGGTEINFAPTRPDHRDRRDPNTCQLVATYQTPTGETLKSDGVILVTYAAETYLYWARLLPDGQTYERLPRDHYFRWGQVLDADLFDPGYFKDWTPAIALSYLDNGSDYNSAGPVLRYDEIAVKVLTEANFLETQSLQPEYELRNLEKRDDSVLEVSPGSKPLHWNFNFHYLYRVGDGAAELRFCLNVSEEQNKEWNITSTYPPHYEHTILHWLHS